MSQIDRLGNEQEMESRFSQLSHKIPVTTGYTYMDRSILFSLIMQLNHVVIQQWTRIFYTQISWHPSFTCDSKSIHKHIRLFLSTTRKTIIVKSNSGQYRTSQIKFVIFNFFLHVYIKFKVACLYSVLYILSQSILLNFIKILCNYLNYMHTPL